MKVNPANQPNQDQFRALDTRAVAAPGQDIRAIEPDHPRGINRRFFFDTARVLLFDGKLTPSQVQGMTAILDEWEYRRSGDDDRKLAYMLATAHHETDRKMMPVDEYGKGAGKKYGKRVKMNGKAYTEKAIYYGRGLVQLTWWDNYRRAGLELYNDARIFLDNPEKVNELPNAVRIMFAGMSGGWFTTKKLADYFAPKKEDWFNARRIINGTDRAELVKSYALKYYAAISYTTA